MTASEQPAFFIYIRSPEGNNELKYYDNHVNLKQCLLTPEHREDFVTPNVSNNDVTRLIVPEPTAKTLEAGELGKFPNLSELEIRFDTHTAIPSDLFVDLELLEHLTIKGGSSSSLNEEIFNGLGKLKRLEIVSQRIIDLDPNVFRTMISLKTLKLVCPNLDHLDDTLFEKQSNVQNLSVYGRIGKIRPAQFANLPLLQELTVSGDPEEFRVSSNVPVEDGPEEDICIDLEPGTIDNLRNLESLNLSYNCLDDVTFNLETLRTLNLDHNKLTGFEPEQTGLKNLCLSNNLIKKIDVNILTDLISLSLSGNPIGSLKPYQFASLSSLERLDLSNCNLKAIEKGHFVGLKTLKTLILSRNQIDHLAPDVFEKLESLTSLDLSDNCLGAFDPAPFQPLAKLETLNVENNGIGILSVEMFSEFVTLKVVFMYRNNVSPEQMKELQKDKPELQFVF